MDTPTKEAVMRFAGSESLRTPAAVVLGAFAAVERLKQVLEIGDPRNFPTDLTLHPKRGQSPFSED